MKTLTFQDLYFADQGKGEAGKGKVKVLFLKNFYFYIDKEEMKGADVEGGWKGHTVEVKNDKRLMNLINKGFGELKSVLTGHDAVYIHRNSGIPLFGTLYFGIVDRGTNILEVKPVTGCNIDCIFCSVFEGKSSRKMVDYVVEKDYILEELENLLEFKEIQKKGEKIDVYINTHGEPLLYGDMIGLVKGMKKMAGVGRVSIITNGLLLNERLIDGLEQAGLDALNVSLNAVDAEKAKELAGSEIYDVERVKNMLRYASGKMKLVIAPVYIKGVNEKEMPGLIDFAKSIGAEMGIQNYLHHKKGKKISQELGWEKFYEKLKELQERHDFRLILPRHEVFTTKQLEKPFKKGEPVEAEIVCDGRKRGEKLAVAKGRVVSVLGCEKQKGKVKVKILKDKDGIFVGRPA